MDYNRFDEIDGLDVLKRLSNEKEVYNTQGNQLYIDDCKMWMTNGELTGVVNITIADILNGKWFVKKPFDIREEMVARPNKWVGAFKNDFDQWCKVGFDSSEMTAVQAKLTDNKAPVSYPYAGVFLIKRDEINRCIPIEEAPKGDLR